MIKLEGTMKEIKMDIRRQNVNEMKKNVCGGDIVSNSHVIACDESKKI